MAKEPVFFISILLSIITISLIGFFITSLISFVLYDLKGVGLHSINSKVDQTLLHLQAEITKYLPGYIPDSVTDLKDEIFAFMKDNVTTLKNTSSDILHNFVTMVMGLIIGILVAIHGFHRRTPQPVFKSLLIQRIQKLSISFKKCCFCPNKKFQRLTRCSLFYSPLFCCRFGEFTFLLPKL